MLRAHRHVDHERDALAARLRDHVAAHRDHLAHERIGRLRRSRQRDQRTGDDHGNRGAEALHDHPSTSARTCSAALRPRADSE